MKTKLFTILVVFLAGTIPAIVSAHVFQSDHEITVLMHTDPDDDVVAGQPATMYFSVTDISNRFSPQNCDCSVVVLNHSNELLNAPLLLIKSPASIFNYQMPFTFLAEGGYQVIMTGDPKTPNAFQPFSVHYTLDVEKNIPQPLPPDHRAGLVSGILAVLILAAYGALVLRHRIVYPE